MSKTLFIADLHLDKRYPQALSAFVRFLDDLKNDRDVDALYILGDLFEYWLGDDCVDNTAKIVANALSDYQQITNTPIYYQHGNRDFLLGSHYAQQCHFDILPEHYVINLYGVKTLLLHGDTLCTDDVDYMRFRAQVRSPGWQANTLRLPSWLRKLKALQLRYRSKKANAQKSSDIMDVAQQTVNNFTRQHAIKRIIHGHTHRPALHTFELDGKTIDRCVVGDWYTQGSVLKVTQEGCQLLVLPLET